MDIDMEEHEDYMEEQKDEVQPYLQNELDAVDYFSEYHGHLPKDMDLAHHLLKTKANKKSFIYLLGDSTMDNKHWLFRDGGDYQGNPDTTTSAWGQACCGYEEILNPKRMVKDVSYWLNYYID